MARKRTYEDLERLEKELEEQKYQEWLAKQKKKKRSRQKQYTNDQAFDAVQEGGDKIELFTESNPIYEYDPSSKHQAHLMALGIIAQRNDDTVLMNKLKENEGLGSWPGELDEEPKFLPSLAGKIVKATKIDEGADAHASWKLSIEVYNENKGKWMTFDYYVNGPGLLSEDMTIKTEFKEGEYIISETFFNTLMIGGSVSKEEAADRIRKNMRRHEGKLEEW